jgi:hypothetical protein
MRAATAHHCILSAFLVFSAITSAKIPGDHEAMFVHSLVDPVRIECSLKLGEVRGCLFQRRPADLSGNGDSVCA